LYLAAARGCIPRPRAVAPAVVGIPALPGPPPGRGLQPALVVIGERLISEGPVDLAPGGDGHHLARVARRGSRTGRPRRGRVAVAQIH
jgi:hypothetical protein